MSSAIESCRRKMFINKVKNRNLNIIPLDYIRVKLPRTAAKKLNDYINPSFIRGTYKDKAYIATQAPKPETAYDFWCVIYFKESLLVVVILTNLYLH